MNITAWDVYLFTRLDSLNVFVFVVLLFGMVSVLLVTFIGFMENEDWKWFGIKKILPCLAPFLLASLLLPSGKEMAAIYLIPRIANSNSANNILAATDNATALLREKVGEWLEDQLGKKKK